MEALLILEAYADEGKSTRATSPLAVCRRHLRIARIGPGCEVGLWKLSRDGSCGRAFGQHSMRGIVFVIRIGYMRSLEDNVLERGDVSRWVDLDAKPLVVWDEAEIDGYRLAWGG